MRTLATLIIALAVASTANASALTQTVIQQKFMDMEACIRTMCIPANDASMSLGYANDLKKQLSVHPNQLDTWTLAHLDPVIAALAAKQLPAALAKTQSTIAALIRPVIAHNLGELEHCLRTMCLPSGDATMGITYATNMVTEMKKYPGDFGTFVTQRLNAAILLLKNKKIAEGLQAVQATIAQLPNP